MSFRSSSVTKQKYEPISKIFYELGLLQQTYNKLDLILINPYQFNPNYAHVYEILTFVLNQGRNK